MVLMNRDHQWYSWQENYYKENDQEIWSLATGCCFQWWNWMVSVDWKWKMMMSDVNKKFILTKVRSKTLIKAAANLVCTHIWVQWDISSLHSIMSAASSKTWVWSMSSFFLPMLMCLHQAAKSTNTSNMHSIHTQTHSVYTLKWVQTVMSEDALTDESSSQNSINLAFNINITTDIIAVIKRHQSFNILKLFITVHCWYMFNMSRFYSWLSSLLDFHHIFFCFFCLSFFLHSSSEMNQMLVSINRIEEMHFSITILSQLHLTDIY